MRKALLPEPEKGGKSGFFEQAHGGTLFLDEISEMNIHLQTRLLRVLQEKEVTRIGGDSVINVDVRIIAASNKKLKTLVNQSAFRKDLLLPAECAEPSDSSPRGAQGRYSASA